MTYSVRYVYDMMMMIQCDDTQPTEDVGGPCDELNHAEAYLNLCGYDSAYDLLQFFYGPLVVRLYVM